MYIIIIIDIEFYKFNVGPGTYDLKEELFARSPKFSFGKEEKMKSRASKSPGVGKYSPTPYSILKAAPSFGMGKLPKGEDYWEKRMKQRSPGPVYKYILQEDSGSKHKLNCAVSLHLYLAIIEAWFW